MHLIIFTCDSKISVAEKQFYAYLSSIIEKTWLWIEVFLFGLGSLDLFGFFPLADLLFLHMKNQSHVIHWETLSLKTLCLSLWVILWAKSCKIVIDFKSQQQKYLIFRWQRVKEEPSGSVLNVNEITIMLG